MEILLDKLRLRLRFRALLPEIDLRNPLIARPAGSLEQHGCSKGDAL